MKKLIVFIMLMNILFAFENSKIENLMGKEQFTSYNQLLSKIFPKKHYTIYEILDILKNNGLLDLFFTEPRVVTTNFTFKGGDNILNTKILNDSLRSLGYYYFYPKNIIKQKDKLSIDIEFKSEHYIDPVSFIDEINSRGCEILDVSREGEEYLYKLSCENGIIKEANILTDENEMYLKANGVYWLVNDDFNKINIQTKNIDFWHPSVWFYDEQLNLLNNIKINKKRTNITLNIPASCKYIKIMDIYSGENFKRGIIVKGLK